MSRNGMFGSGPPGYNPLTLSDAILGLRPEPPTNAFLSGLTPPLPTSNAFLSALAGPPRSGDFLSGLTDPLSAAASALAQLMVPPKVVVPDYGVDYTFDVFPISYRPAGKNCVYIFAKDRCWMYYAGIAEDLFNRLTGHERMHEVIEMGANEVWVHTPGPNAIFGYKEAERRLIERHCFPLNKQHNPLAAIFP
ncbi:MAG TPA: GIY-YIG nuclease family protein [Hyphomonadaceae bacterium]|nr:GIY-YIG nuclease family protein [Hyphomonadaceae bacterium]